MIVGTKFQTKPEIGYGLWRQPETGMNSKKQQLLAGTLLIASINVATYYYVDVLIMLI